MTITFCGAAETVTGSRFVCESADHRVLVDCGLFQGIKRLRELNWSRFPVEPASIDAVLVTHAHIDHSGYLPALVRDGFGGDIWCTPGTAALARVLLLDSAHLHEEDARVANRRKSSRHKPALPLYTRADAERCLEHLHPVAPGATFTPVPGIDALFTPNGHILGSASVRLDDARASVSFTGDVGRASDPIMRPPEPLPAADHVVTESTYGNRSHGDGDASDELEAAVNRTVGRGGTLLLPVFAVGRAQTVLHLLTELRLAGRIPEVPTCLNSPMAIEATDLFLKLRDEHKLSDEECRRMRDGVEFVRTVEESKELASRHGPMIVLAASGMATGGRVLHHLEQLLPDHRNTVLFTGYQAPGTRGDAMVNGARQIKIWGRYIAVRAEVEQIDSLSAHADADELVAWLSQTPVPRWGASVVHGEAAAADTLRLRLRDELGWEARVPGYRDVVHLPDGLARRGEPGRPAPGSAGGRGSR
jgi:metallo-beta-lactamase family protein